MVSFVLCACSQQLGAAQAGAHAVMASLMSIVNYQLTHYHMLLIINCCITCIIYTHSAFSRTFQDHLHGQVQMPGACAKVNSAWPDLDPCRKLYLVWKSINCKAQNSVRKFDNLMCFWLAGFGLAYALNDMTSCRHNDWACLLCVALDCMPDHEMASCVSYGPGSRVPFKFCFFSFFYW